MTRYIKADDVTPVVTEIDQITDQLTDAVNALNAQLVALNDLITNATEIPDPPAGKQVVFQAPYTDATQWTVGRSSAYPGPVGGYQTNQGDNKSDRISPTVSAPDTDGTFRATRVSADLWNADLVTTEYSTGNFQVQVGDELTADVTLNNQTGAWPAIWTWSTGTLAGMTGHGEVDLFEYHGENATMLEFTNHVASPVDVEYVGGKITPGVQFALKVKFLADGVEHYVNGELLAKVGTLPSNWKSNLIVNLSVASVGNPWHPEPPTSVNALHAKVTNLKVWR